MLLFSATKDWISDPSAWEDDERDHKFGVPIDFPYRYDANGNPILLVPNTHEFQKHKYFRVEFDQTLTVIENIGFYTRILMCLVKTSS